MTREEMRKRFASVDNATPKDAETEEVVENVWTHEEMIEIMEKILKRDHDRFKFLGWL